MNAARIAAAAAALAVCTLYGAVRSSRLDGMLKGTDDMLSDVRRAASLIELEHKPLEEIAKILAETGKCKRLWADAAQAMRGGAPFSAAYNTAVKPASCAEAEAVMDELALSLGTGDVRSEANRLLLAAEKLSRIRAAKEEELGQRSRLVSVLSVIFGLAAALLII